MKGINIAKTLVNKRKEKGITQDELADFIGVSKASVSKWETGQSYPDIVFIPQLASYFNISIDELMGYEPQMETTDIKELIKKLTADFSLKPFDDVIENCNEIIKKYYACFPLLLHMANLLMSHSALIGDNTDKITPVMIQAKELYAKVKNESDDIWLKKQALHLEAGCALALGDPASVLDLMNGTNEPFLPTDELLAQAYQMSDNPDKAKKTLQISAFKHVLALIKTMPMLLFSYTDNAERYEEIYDCTISVTDMFNVKEINPYGLIGIYAVAAQGFITIGNIDKALDNLQKYTDIVTSGMNSINPQGNAFFDLVDNWINLPESNMVITLNNKIMRKGLLDAITKNSAFISLNDNPRYQCIIKKLNNYYGGNEC